jgi:hypothetical protein
MYTLLKIICQPLKYIYIEIIVQTIISILTKSLMKSHLQ